MKLFFCTLIFLISSNTLAQVCEPEISPVPFGGSLYVGNAGEGVCIDGQLYLRDLYEYGNYLNPRIGNRADRFFLEALKNSSLWNLLMVEDIGPFARKLTDLQTLSPQLGRFVWEAIAAHRWILVNAPFQIVPDDGSGLGLPSRIPLANRLVGTIRIQEATWKSLTPEHRVALVLHEAISSLIKPVCDADRICLQSSGKIRDIVGIAFEDPQNPLYRLPEDLEISLQIPSRKSRQSKYEDIIVGQIGDIYFEHQEIKNTETLQNFFEKYCGVLEKSTAPAEEIALFFIREPFKRALSASYRTRSGELLYDQQTVSFGEVPRDLQIHKIVQAKPTMSKNLCIVRLGRIAQKWYEYHPYFDTLFPWIRNDPVP